MNYWILGQKNTAEYSAFLSPADGNLDKVSLVDDSLDIGHLPMLQDLVMTAGRQVKTDLLPTRVTCEGSIDDVDDLMLVHTNLTVSEALKVVIEDMSSPGDIQFEPFDVISKNTGEFLRRRYWLISNVRLFAMDKEKTKPALAPIGYFRISTPLRDCRIVFDAEKTAGRPIFATAEYPGVYFVSDDFVQRVEASGLTGARFRWKFPAE